MKKQVVIVAIHVNHSDLGVRNFLDVAGSFVHKVSVESEACDDNVSPVSKRKQTFTTLRH